MLRPERQIPPDATQPRLAATGMTWRRWRFAAAAVSLLVTLSLSISDARAQDVSSQDKAAEAEALFDKGRELMMTAGQLDAACEALAESLALMERGDTYMNLAECHRRQGKTATAWRELGKALEHAKTVKFKEAIETARAIRADLEAKLSTLTVRVPKTTAGLEGLAVELNGVPLPREKWGTPMVLDPQTHTVTATAKGQQPFSSAIELGDDKDAKEITVTLEPVPKAAPPPPAPTPPPPPPSTGGGVHPMAIIGFVAGGVGFVAYGILGGLALDRRSEFDDSCPDDLCPAGSEDDIDEAILFADLATGALALGVAGAGVGLFGLLYFGTDGDDGDDGGASVSLAAGLGSVTLRGQF